MRFRKIGPGRAEECLALSAACAARLTREFGKGHWSGVCTLATWKRRAADKDVMVAEDSGSAVATFMLEERKPGFVSAKKFSEPRDSFLWLTNFFVDPARWREGIGRACMEEMKRLAKTKHRQWIRFDAYAAPAGAGGFYEKCGCVPIDTASPRGCPLLVFELAT